MLLGMIKCLRSASGSYGYVLVGVNRARNSWARYAFPPRLAERGGAICIIARASVRAI